MYQTFQIQNLRALSKVLKFLKSNSYFASGVFEWLERRDGNH